jgi:signal transduction histidine kinase
MGISGVDAAAPERHPTGAYPGRPQHPFSVACALAQRMQVGTAPVLQMTDPSPPQAPAAAGPLTGDGASNVAEIEHLREALRVSEAKRRELDEFISLLAHDLRTPLTSIRGYAQLLLRQRSNQPPLLPSVASGLNTIIEQSDRLAAQTELLLDVSRVRLHRLVLVTREIDLAAVVQSVLARFTSGVAPLDDQSTPGDLRVSGDFDRLRRAVHTLVEFGVDHGAEAGDVHVTLARQGTNGSVTVDAPGAALDAEAQDAIFSRLYDPNRTDAVDRLKPCAMYVARGLAEAHGGGVDAISPIPGASDGLRLALCVPLAVPAA